MTDPCPCWYDHHGYRYAVDGSTLGSELEDAAQQLTSAERADFAAGVERVHAVYADPAAVERLLDRLETDR